MIKPMLSDAEGIIQNIDGTLNQMAAMPRGVAARQIMLGHVKEMASALAADTRLPPDAKNAATIIAGVSDAEMTPVMRITDVAPTYSASLEMPVRNDPPRGTPGAPTLVPRS